MKKTFFLIVGLLLIIDIAVSGVIQSHSANQLRQECGKNSVPDQTLPGVFIILPASADCGVGAFNFDHEYVFGWPVALAIFTHRPQDATVARPFQKITYVWNTLNVVINVAWIITAAVFVSVILNRREILTKRG